MSFAFAKEIVHNTLHYPPYWVEHNSKISGYHYDLAKEIYKEAKLDIKIESVPYARISQFNFEDNVAIVAYGSNEKTDSKLLFPIPMTTIRLNIYSLKKNPPKSIEQLLGKSIAVKRGFPLGQFSGILKDKNYTVYSTKTVKQAIHMLLAKRVDYIILLEDPFDSEYKDSKYINKNIHKNLLSELKGWPIAIIKNHPKASMLYSKIKNAYERLLQKKVIKYKNNKVLLTKDNY